MYTGIFIAKSYIHVQFDQQIIRRFIVLETPFGLNELTIISVERTTMVVFVNEPCGQITRRKVTRTRKFRNIYSIMFLVGKSVYIHMQMREH